MGRAPCCDKANVKKGPWSPEEDAKLKSYIEKHGTGGNWIALPQKIGLKRCGKSCRLRWLNYLRPNIKHGGFSEEEDRIILSLYISIGSRWSVIAAQLPGRTDNDIKNYWNTRLKKKLFGKQRKSGTRKQEVNTKDENQTLIMDNNEVRNGMYWANPTVPVQQMTGQLIEQHDPIKKLLYKLGTNPKMITPFLDPSSVSPQVLTQIYDIECTSLIAPSMEVTSHSEGLMQGNIDRSISYPIEMEEIFCFNQVKLEGLDSFFGDGGVGTVHGLPEQMKWSTSEINSLVNPNFMPIQGFQGLQQCVFDDQVNLIGMQ